MRTCNLFSTMSVSTSLFFVGSSIFLPFALLLLFLLFKEEKGDDVVLPDVIVGKRTAWRAETKKMSPITASTQKICDLNPLGCVAQILWTIGFLPPNIGDHQHHARISLIQQHCNCKTRVMTVVTLQLWCFPPGFVMEELHLGI